MAEYEAVGGALEEAVRRACEGKRCGVAFSGGMDSGLIAALAGKYARSVTCYTCGSDDAFDVAAGRELADKLGLPWHHCRISQENITDTVRQMITASGCSDPFTISYDLQLFTVLRDAKEEIIFSGQGSDEYFNGCANAVNDSDEEYERVRQWGIDRMNKVSNPCERRMAAYFGKVLEYPYQDSTVVSEVEKLNPALLRPKELENRKKVLKDICVELGFPILAHRVKKASQYGSKTTDLIRKAAKAEGLPYNKFIAVQYCMRKGMNHTHENEFIDVRVDPMLKYDAEQVMEKEGKVPQEVIEMFYSKIAREGNLDFLE
ncbi:MAG: asparagine synthase-related protein [archaeon]|nr:asparagine synthase-related protein [archaeon]